MAAVLVAGGGSALGWAATHQGHAPQPAAAAAGTLDPSAAETGPGRAATGSGRRPASPTASSPEPSPARMPATPAPVVAGPTLPRSLPTRIRIPAIGVDSALLHLGENPDGTLQVPPLDGSPETNMAGWFDGSPTPGQLGPSIILGHVDSAAQGPSVFFRLGALAPGDQVLVNRQDGTTATFTVNAVRRYTKTAFPTSSVYGNTDYAALRLITCGGPFDPATRHYLDNIVVFAHLTGGGHG